MLIGAGTILDDVVKIFPAGLFGTEMIKAIKGPLPQALLMPTGGINLNNIQEWFKVGVFALELVAV